MTQKEAEHLAEAVRKSFAKALTRLVESGIIKADGEWDESKHPRDENGRFSGGGFSNSTPQEFHDAVAAAKASCPADKRWRVDVHDPNDYEGVKLHVTEGGSTVAVTSDGDIISVCKNINDSIRGQNLMEMAVKSGGVKLDSFSGNHGFYTKCGFEPVSWTPFNKEYAPPGWTDGVHKEEPVIFYKYTGNKNSSSVNDFLSNTPPCTGADGYDKAKEIRDKDIEKG